MKILQVSLSYKICTWNQTFCSVSAHGNDSNYFQLNLIHTRQNYIAFHYSSLYNWCLFVYWQQKTKTLLAARASGYVHTFTWYYAGSTTSHSVLSSSKFEDKTDKKNLQNCSETLTDENDTIQKQTTVTKSPCKTNKKTSDVFQAVIQRIKCLQKELFKISSLLGKKKMKHLQI